MATRPILTLRDRLVYETQVTVRQAPALDIGPSRNDSARQTERNSASRTRIRNYC